MNRPPATLNFCSSAPPLISPPVLILVRISSSVRHSRRTRIPASHFPLEDDLLKTPHPPRWLSATSASPSRPERPTPIRIRATNPSPITQSENSTSPGFPNLLHQQILHALKLPFQILLPPAPVPYGRFPNSLSRFVMEDHLSDQATAGDGPDGARALLRRSARVDDQDLGFKYTA